MAEYDKMNENYLQTRDTAAAAADAQPDEQDEDESSENEAQ